MSFIIGANSASGGFSVDNSVRLDDGSSSYLQKSASAGNRKTFTFSTWLKRSNLTVAYHTFFSSDQAVSNSFRCTFSSDAATDDKIMIYFYTGSFELKLITNRLFRDPSAWYHIVIAVDTTQGTASNRAKLYVNGVQETSFATATYPSLNLDTSVNQSGAPTRVGAGTSLYFDGYMAETVLLDGTAADPTSFGESNEDSGVWQPIDVSGLTFGTNGFYLDYKDSAELGTDANGGTNLTETNLTAIDQTTDTPINNFATMNPLDNFYSAATFSEGNCKVITGGSPDTWNTSTFGVASGKWYCEIKLTNVGSGGSTLVGITDRPTVSATEELGGLATTYAYLNSGNFRTNNTNTSNGVASAAGDIIGIALDLDSEQNTISYYKNNVLIVAAQNITAPVSGHYFIASGDWLEGAFDVCTNEHNFGNPTFTGTDQADGNGYGSFEYAPPSGYLALCTKNLSEVLS